LKFKLGKSIEMCAFFFSVNYILFLLVVKVKYKSVYKWT